MKAREVIEILRISRPTLYRWKNEGKIKARKLPNGLYDYDDESVYKLLLERTGKPPARKTVIYARVSTRNQKKK